MWSLRINSCSSTCVCYQLSTNDAECGTVDPYDNVKETCSDRCVQDALGTYGRRFIARGSTESLDGVGLYHRRRLLTHAPLSFSRSRFFVSAHRHRRVLENQQLQRVRPIAGSRRRVLVSLYQYGEQQRLHESASNSRSRRAAVDADAAADRCGRRRFIVLDGKRRWRDVGGGGTELSGRKRLDGLGGSRFRGRFCCFLVGGFLYRLVDSLGNAGVKMNESVFAGVYI